MEIGFSAIARSVMISAWPLLASLLIVFSFSAIARSVMISAPPIEISTPGPFWFQCYSS